jgi:hypothetical protein
MISLYEDAVRDSQMYQSDAREHVLGESLKRINMTPRCIKSIHEVVWLGTDSSSSNFELIDPRNNNGTTFPLALIRVIFLKSKGREEKVWMDRQVFRLLYKIVVADDLIFTAAQEQEERRK